MTSVSLAWHGGKRTVRTLSRSAGALICLACWPGHSSAADLSFRDFPYLIFCESHGTDYAFYFSRLGSDGRAIYLTPDNQAGTITIDGVALRVGGDQSGSCFDKTLDELRASGQAFDLPAR
ncbi:MAG: hypothetical protein M9924_11340 [Rhizobiaceae bacterium]|nr:hypothetical protein [Rhizobiaceae bacterium]